MAKAKPFDEVFPGMRRGRSPNKAPTKKLVSLRLSPVVLEHFKAFGRGWQSRIDETLLKAVKKAQKSI
ncbi:BrnA antitoxin family protein [Bradyrhizobium japonicum]|uniref:BrnA antitoxin family protein n=1 Tax=Bradyrhizobium japonicum TaxID=375 RepID=UPI00041A2673